MLITDMRADVVEQFARNPNRESVKNCCPESKEVKKDVKYNYVSLVAWRLGSAVSLDRHSDLT